MTGEQQAGFDAFWAAWPKRVAKKAAFRAWSRVSPELYPAVMAALARHKRLPAWQKDGGAYIPHAATWLNGERWNDEVALPEDRDAEILIAALREHVTMPPDFPANIAARFRALCARMVSTWPRIHDALAAGRVSEAEIKKTFTEKEVA